MKPGMLGLATAGEGPARLVARLDSRSLVEDPCSRAISLRDAAYRLK